MRWRWPERHWREGISTLPAAALEAPAREVKLLLDHREDLICERTRIQNRLRWLLHDRWAELELPTGCLDRMVWLERLSGRLQRSSQDADVRVMRHQIRRLRELVRETKRSSESYCCSCAGFSLGCLRSTVLARSPRPS
jgi:hypothetical protein